MSEQQKHAPSRRIVEKCSYVLISIRPQNRGFVIGLRLSWRIFFVCEMPLAVIKEIPDLGAKFS